MIDLLAHEVKLSNISVADAQKSKNVRTNFKSVLSDEILAVETFNDMWKSTLEENFGHVSQNFCHITDASEIPLEIWTHNDFPYEKFLTNEVDISVLNWKPTRSNPSQLDSGIQSRLTATLGKERRCCLQIPQSAACVQNAGRERIRHDYGIE